MTKEFFKEFCKHIKSEIIEGIPKGEALVVLRGVDDPSGDFFSISCGGYRYDHSRDGIERITAPEGLDDEED